MFYRDNLDSFCYIIIFSGVMLTNVSALAGVPEYNTHVSVLRFIYLYTEPATLWLMFKREGIEEVTKRVLTYE
jgi:hypothetical protein